MATNDTVNKYFESLLTSYDILVEAVGKANERGLKVSQQVAADIVKGQREALELGQKFASEPTDMSGFYSALVESATAAQGRALQFAQVAYTEAVSAGTDVRETFQKLMEANKETSQAAVQAARSLYGQNPWAEAMKKGFEAFTAKPEAKKKEPVRA